MLRIKYMMTFLLTISILLASTVFADSLIASEDASMSSEVVVQFDKPQVLPNKLVVAFSDSTAQHAMDETQICPRIPCQSDADCTAPGAECWQGRCVCFP